MPEDREAEELKDTQLQREAAERELARTASDDEELAQHQRRADKARYLRHKLEERVDSERKSDG